MRLFRRRPVPLARALVKISCDLQLAKEQGYKPATSMNAFYVGEAELVNERIVSALKMGREEELKNALKKEKSVFEMFSTHPCMVSRLKALLEVN